MTPPPVLSSDLTWSTIAHNRGCELKRQGVVVGTLQHPALFSSGYLAETPHGRWTFRRCGLLGAGTQILDTSSQQQIASFRSVWGGGGVLTFTGGDVFHLECKGWSRPQWYVKSVSGQTLLCLHTRERTVDLLLPAAISEARISLLLMFALYRLQQAEEDAASAAMVG